MEKLHHVFVSSTFVDLIDERRVVSEMISRAGHVPAGMEIFPASSQKQFDFIKRVIDRCDYYVLVIAGRYGSMTTANISYTEMEFDYAMSKGMPILAFLHADPSSLPMIKSESVEKDRLEHFKSKVREHSLIDHWRDAGDLSAKVVSALTQEIASNPGIGWVRANRAVSSETAIEIEAVRAENIQLRTKLAEALAAPIYENLAEEDERFSLRYTYQSGSEYGQKSAYVILTWRKAISVFGPDFRINGNEASIRDALRRYVREELGKSWSVVTPYETDVNMILNQLEIMGILYRLNSGNLKLSDKGVRLTQEFNAVFSSKTEN